MEIITSGDRAEGKASKAEMCLCILKKADSHAAVGKD